MYKFLIIEFAYFYLFLYIQLKTCKTFLQPADYSF